MKKVLEVRHLTKRYGQHLALDNVNLTLEKGEGLWPYRKKWGR